MRVLLAGASGLLGTALHRSLTTNGHAVRQLVRRAPADPDEVRWDPASGHLEASALADVDAVVCLSGAGIADRRWTESYKKTLLTSRLQPVGTLARAVAAAEPHPVLITASAVGYYGDTGDRAVDESAPPGSGFLAKLCVQWEAAAEPAAAAGARVVQLRTGLVLTGDGGLLKRLKPLVQTGLAGRLGGGQQYQPWISLADEIAAIEFLLEHDVAGPVNLTGPEPVTNAALMTALGRVLHRPTALPTPSIALRIVLGELAQDVLEGQRAMPAALQAAGFTWQHNDVESALRWALGR